MKCARIEIGFVPLLDAAPLLVAQEMGFAAEEGLSLDFHRAPSWSSARDALSFGQVTAAHMLSPVPVATAMGLGGGSARLDALSFGQVTAAHMLSPVPVATAMGLGGGSARLDALSVLSMNGTVVGVSGDLARRMRDAGHAFDFADARAAGRALLASAPEPLRIGVPFPFSMHAELIFYWLSALGHAGPPGLSIRTVPPPLMAEAVRAGEIDAFCVGEPWGSKAVESGMGELLLPGSAIWAFAPEKVLAVRRDWAEDAPELAGRLIRSVWRAGRWLDTEDGRSLASELLSRPQYLGISPELVERGLSGRMTIAATGETRTAPRFVAFHDGHASFPWRSQAAWIGGQLASRTGHDRLASMRAASAVFRSDLYRAALATTGAELPAASSRREGTLGADSRVPGTRGETILYRDAFFDGRIFDPAF